VNDEDGAAQRAQRAAAGRVPRPAAGDRETEDEQLVDALADVWGSIDSVCDGLTEAQWKTETECPGWSVQDNVSHIVGLEATILGRPDPDHAPPDLPHVKNDIGKRNEVWVDALRSHSGAEVLAELREVTGERLRALRAMSGDDFGAESWTPVGPGTVRDLLPFRVFDSWAHEQDMRRALGVPGGTAGPAAHLALARILSTLGFVVGKKVAPGDGTTVVFDYDGNATAIGVDGERARSLDDVPDDPTVRLTMDVDTLVRLSCGRGDPDEIVDSGAVRITGDKQLGRRVAQEMNFLF